MQVTNHHLTAHPVNIALKRNLLMKDSLKRLIVTLTEISKDSACFCAVMELPVGVQSSVSTEVKSLFDFLLSRIVIYK